MKPVLLLLCLLSAASCAAQTYQTNTPAAAQVALTYTTNVVESDNHQGEPIEAYFRRIIQMPAQTNWSTRDPSLDQRPYIAPTERTWTTNVTEHLVVTLRVSGEDRTLEQDRVVSSRAYTEVLRNEWVPKEAKQFLTNSHSTWINTPSGPRPMTVEEYSSIYGFNVYTDYSIPEPQAIDSNHTSHISHIRWAISGENGCVITTNNGLVTITFTNK